MMGKPIADFENEIDQLALSYSPGGFNNWHSAGQLSSALVVITEDEFVGTISHHSMQPMYSPMATVVSASGFGIHQANISSDAFYKTGDTPSDFDNLTHNPNIDNAQVYSAGTNLTIPTLSAVPTQEIVAAPSAFPCTYSCNKFFTRPSDLDRHNRSFRHINRGTHLCPVATCIKSRDRGYSRADKLGECGRSTPIWDMSRVGRV